MRQTLTKVLQKNKSTLFIRPILNIKYAKILWNSVNKVFCVIGTGISLMAIDQQRHIHSQMYIRNSFEVTILLQSPECFFCFVLHVAHLKKRLWKELKVHESEPVLIRTMNSSPSFLKHIFSPVQLFSSGPLFLAVPSAIIKSCLRLTFNC